MTEYQYVKIKAPFNRAVFFNKISRWLFYNPKMFLVNMIVYHTLVAVTTFILMVNVPAKVWLRLGMGDVAFVQAEMTAVGNFQTSLTNLIILGAIIFLDFCLLIIISKEIPSLGLTSGRILLLEVPIFLLGYWNPYVRAGLLFFSANTLQIAIAYRWMIKKWVVFQYFFLAGSYILILKLLWFIFWQMW